jgi:hypothetical protein
MQRQIFVSCINAEKDWVKDSDARIAVYRCLLATRYVVDDAKQAKKERVSKGERNVLFCRHQGR